VLMTPEFLK